MQCVDYAVPCCTLPACPHARPPNRTRPVAGPLSSGAANTVGLLPTQGQVKVRWPARLAACLSARPPACLPAGADLPVHVASAPCALPRFARSAAQH